jgi:cell division cycle 2-like
MKAWFLLHHKLDNDSNLYPQIFAVTGPPTQKQWPAFRSLPHAKALRLPDSLNANSSTPLLPRSKFPYLTNAGLTLLSSLLALNPASRPDAATCLKHPYFREDPRPKAKEMFPTFPSKAGLERRRRNPTPEAPKHGEEAPQLDFANVFGGAVGGDGDGGAGFTLRLG